MSNARLVEIRHAHPSRDGAGMSIQRLHDFSGGLDPLLMLDELQAPPGSGSLPGFPDHPHRGFETLTLVRHGTMDHRDHLGNRGRIEAGGAQWMRAGRGVIHSEMPAAGPEGLHAFQLWINLPAAGRMAEPCYLDVGAERMAMRPVGSGQLVAVAGHWQAADWETAIRGPIGDLGMQAAAVAWLQLPPQSEAVLEMPENQRLFLRTVSGKVEDGPGAGALGVYADGIRLVLRTGPEPLLAILVRGRALNEPIAQHGPFVMNHPQEIHEALQDYRAGQLARA